MSAAEVVIVGAGPVGLSLSLALARYEVPSVVLDNGSGDVPARSARSCVLRPDTAVWLPAAGPRTARWSRWSTWRRRQLVEDVELDPETSPVHLEQHSLERSLRAALAMERLARVVTDSHLDLLEQDADGVTAHTRTRHPTDGASAPGSVPAPEPPNDHASGERRESGAWWRGSFLVGCDGARSTVRKLLGVRFTGRTAVERHAVAALRVQLPWADEAWLHRDPGGQPGEVTARPLPGGVWRLDWLLPPRGELVTPDELLERVHTTLAHWQASTGKDGHDGRPNGAADDAGPYELLDTGVYTSHQRLARRWRVDRVFLAGDAAHLTGALGVQSVDEGLRDVANLAWKLALAWHDANGSPGRAPRSGQDATDTLLDSYESERRSAVVGRLRAVDQALPHVRREGGGVRGLLPGGARSRLGLLTDGHLGRGVLGGPADHGRTPLAPEPDAVDPVPAGTSAGAPVHDVPVTALDGQRGRLRDWLGGRGGELLALLVAPGTAVWESRHWLSAGLMPELAAAVQALPLHGTLLVTEEYPGTAPHTVLVIRADGHLLTALPGARPEQLAVCAEALRGAADADRPAPASGDHR